MPTYEYRCPDGHLFEHFVRKISDSVAELPCPECGKTAARQMSAGAGLVFKGSGFYLTDYGKNAHRKTEGGESKGEARGESKGEAKGEGSSAGAGAESKSDSGGGEKGKSAESKPAESKASSGNSEKTEKRDKSEKSDKSQRGEQSQGGEKSGTSDKPAPKTPKAGD